MHNDQHQEIRPFTFYNEQEDFEDTIKEQLCSNDEMGREVCSVMDDQKEKKCKMLRKLSKKRSDIGLFGKFVAVKKESEKYPDNNRESSASNNCDSLLEKPQDRKGKLTKISIKKTENSQQNSQHLKAHLQQLLKNDHILIQTQDDPTIQESKSCLPIRTQKQSHNIVYRSQIFTSPLQMNENLSLGKMDNKEKILFLHASKNDRANFMNLICSKNTDQLKKKAKEKLFPRISKKSNSVKMKDNHNFDSRKVRKEVYHKTRYQNPARHDEQSYLGPIKTDRNARKKPYIINIENLYPRELTHSSTEKSNTKVSFHSECEHLDTRLLLEAAKCIKFK